MHKANFTVLLFLLLSFITADAFAARPGLASKELNQNETLASIESVDITSVVEFYRSKIRVVASPFKIYNWLPAGQVGDQNQTNWAQKQSRLFWEKYGSKDYGGTYGFGLYGAADPASTSHFAGKENWLLTEMMIPPNTKILNPEDIISIPFEVKKIINLFECDLSSHRNFFSGGGTWQPLKCQLFVRKIFQTILKIDLISFAYGTYNFGCTANQYTQRGFVVIRDEWMTPELIRYYNSASTHHREDRILIQSLFFSQSSEDPIISQSEGAMTPMGKLLWSDLAGEKKSKSILEWMMINKFACSGQVPYR